MLVIVRAIVMRRAGIEIILGGGVQAQHAVTHGAARGQDGNVSFESVSAESVSGESAPRVSPAENLTEDSGAPLRISGLYQETLRWSARTAME